MKYRNVLSQLKLKIRNIKESRLIIDSFWAVFGSAIGKGLSLIAGIYVARYLGSDVYGEYGMIRSTLLYIAVFSTFGLGYSATKFIAEVLSKDLKSIISIHKIVNNITIISSGILALLLFIFAKPIAQFMDGPDLYIAFRISSIAIIFNALTTTQIGELSGFKKFKTIAKNNAYSGIVTFVFSVLLTSKWGFYGAITALTLSLGFNFLINSNSSLKI